ncbi:MAG: LemA family protein [bacterium]|nr:LemA family protein [bacterium]
MLVIAGIIIFVIAYFIITYNSLVALKVRIKASIQEIGNQLKRQASLIPNLIEATKGYMQHEQEVFDKLTAARNVAARALEKNKLPDLIKASEQLGEAFQPMFALLESNPELKANETVAKLMDELRDTADKVMYARRLLIDLSANYNIKIKTFPTMFVAKLFNFQPVEGLKTAESGAHLKVSQAETKTPKVNL